jgi:hypothetical protein
MKTMNETETNQQLAGLLKEVLRSMLAHAAAAGHRTGVCVACAEHHPKVAVAVSSIAGAIAQTGASEKAIILR